MANSSSAPSFAGRGRLHPVALLASVFGLGYMPVAPGTFGSLVGLPVAYALYGLTLPAACLVLGALILVSVLVAARAERVFVGHDASEIVLDEVVGMAVSLVAIPPSLGLYAAGFVLFRFFDAVKPGPIGWLDRRVPGGLGVVLDDVAAGLASLTVLHLGRLCFA